MPIPGKCTALVANFHLFYHDLVLPDQLRDLSRVQDLFRESASLLTFGTQFLAGITIPIQENFLQSLNVMKQIFESCQIDFEPLSIASNSYQI